MKQIQQCFVAFLLVLFITQNLTVTISTNNIENRGNETDHIALLAIKDQLLDHPIGYLNSWNHSLHHCYWDGVTCGRKHHRVIALNLTARVSGGTLSPFIGNLSFLTKVWLPLNNLHGEIPPQIGRLRRLRLLQLTNNTLTGEITSNISGCINLRGIGVGFNKLYGSLPSSLRACSKLQQLVIHYNNFTGVLFDTIANLTSLEHISATGNDFTGTIPNSIGTMRNLSTLFIGENQLSGVVPTSFYNLSSIQELSLIGNKFRGTLPEDIGVRLPRLELLNLGFNKFHGKIPKSITNLTKLELIGLEWNDFIGKVPDDFSQFKNLDNLDLFNNHLEGEINFVGSLVNCSNLQFLDLSVNKFTGKLPGSVANLSSTIIWLTVGYNLISGEIPVGINNLVDLQHLSMRRNEFTGIIPDDFGSLQYLDYINFGSNILTGKIPSSVGNLSKLSKLYLNDNKLQGSIPSDLGNCQSLLYFDVSGNELNGTLPREIFGGSAMLVAISVSKNQLEGFLPLEIGKQVNIVHLDLSTNKFSGEIPGDIGDCSALQYLNMHGNNFHGSIPSSFASLASLQTLDLSRNNLSGRIPDYLSKFPLLYLNLSYNSFEGRVPTTGVFANVSAVSLVGNIGLCGGIPELNLSRCVEQKKKNKSRRISRAFSLTIPIISAVVVVVIIATLLYITCCLRKRKAVSLGSETRQTLMKVSYNMLLKATDGFASSKLLGAGAYGSVFKGVLDGKTVAIKVLDLKYRGALKSFMAECKALRNIRHRNLVGMITACSSIDFQGNDFKALVYEFMPNGSLDRLLHIARNMSLVQRLEIAIHVAHALCYLHNDCEIPIIHCDLKPSNVLLDSDMVAKVGDFGISKFLVGLQQLEQSSTTGIKGTVGYAPPEYGLGSEASTSGDIYSYGILLLELMTGKTPTDEMFKENCNLHMYAEAALPDRILQIIDPILVDSELTEEIDDRITVQNTVQQRLECMSSIVAVGVACSNHLPHLRMKISEVISKLQVAKESLLKAGYRRAKVFSILITDSSVMSQQSFAKHLYGSVSESDYFAMRTGFIMTHCRNNPNFNFYDYMMRAFEADFAKVISISWYVWVIVVISLLLNLAGWHMYFWIAFLPLTLLLILGTKLEQVITVLATEVVSRHSEDVEEIQIQPSDHYFWFNKPKITLLLINVILSCNSFAVALFFWVYTRYGFHPCSMDRNIFTIPRLIIVIIVQILLSYSTLPLYAIVTQMGSSCHVEAMENSDFGSIDGDAHTRRGFGSIDFSEETVQPAKMLEGNSEVQSNK